MQPLPVCTLPHYLCPEKAPFQVAVLYALLWLVANVPLCPPRPIRRPSVLTGWRAKKAQICGMRWQCWAVRTVNQWKQSWRKRGSWRLDVPKSNHNFQLLNRHAHVQAHEYTSIYIYIYIYRCVYLLTWFYQNTFICMHIYVHICLSGEGASPNEGVHTSTDICPQMSSYHCWPHKWWQWHISA